jgi:hypothetical protein
MCLLRYRLESLMPSRVLAMFELRAADSIADGNPAVTAACCYYGVRWRTC